MWPFRPSPRRASPASLLAYVRAGCPGSVQAWLALDPAVQEALEAAGDRVFAERAAVLAGAVRGEPEALQAISRAVDGGLSAEDAAARMALDKAGAMLTRRAPP